MDLLSKVSVQSIAKSLPPEELAACVQEAIAWQRGRVLVEGTLRKVAARLVVESGIDEDDSLRQAETAILREAALRFCAAQTGLRADEL